MYEGINSFDEEAIFEWEENDEMDTWESAFWRGEQSAYAEEDEEEVWI